MSTALDKLSQNSGEGRIPVIVIGSGISVGAGAPKMSALHHYLDAKLSAIKSDENPTLPSIRRLLRLLQRGEPNSPRSVQVRLYNLLQKSENAGVRRIWSDFGVSLMSGEAALWNRDKPVTPEQIAKEARPMWTLAPTEAHRWAARLAIQGRAVLVSLNYDGLTRQAIDQEAEKLMAPPPDQRRTARILSTAEEIRQFYTGSEKDLASDLPTDRLPWRPVPLIKFRGDIFHAVCENGRCPEHGEQVPIYHLPAFKRREPSPTGDPQLLARTQLACPSCGRQRELGISFPGVFDKEKEIDRALAAFHEIYGNSLAGVICLGFSGRWDEALVDYLAGRAHDTGGPLISLGFDGTPALREAAGKVGVPYEEFKYNSLKEDPSVLGKLLAPAAALGAPAVDLSSPVTYDPEAFNFFKEMGDTVRIKLPARDERLEITKERSADGFAGIAGDALQHEALRNLQRCSQLGLKSCFLHEKDRVHTRYTHSAAAAMIAMVWYEALRPQFKQTRSWSGTQEARTALELAVLFHDARHLPFSHMMEEVFQELNWGGRASAWPDIPRYTEVVVKNFYQQIEDPLRRALAERAGMKLDKAEVWWKQKVAGLQESQIGVPWLEAIMDSALDADKIEYIFHDTHLTKQNVRLTDWQPWFERFIGDQVLTPEGLIRLEGESCTAAVELLQERMHLYRRLYLAPELRALECLARYIVVTWLEWRIPEQMGPDSAGPANYNAHDNLRTRKAQIAGKELWEMFNPKPGQPQPANELQGLKLMVERLRGEKHLDEAAKDWIKALWEPLSTFDLNDGTRSPHPTMEPARTTFAKLSPIGPLYVHARHEASIRRIIRTWRANYPMVALVDLVKFPRFLSTPRHRYREIGFARATAEQFLVPGAKPSDWRRGQRATTPLHLCDFSAFEHPVLQLLILDPRGSASGGSAFLHQMLQREFQRHGIETFESPEQVKPHHENTPRHH